MKTSTKLQISLLLPVLSFLLLMPVTQNRPVIADPEVSQIFRNIAVVTDKESIDILLADFLIPEDVENVEKLEIIDVSNIGFGRDDIVVVFPSMNVYILDQPSEEISRVMRSWGIQEQRRDASIELTSEYFYPGSTQSIPESELQDQQIDLVQRSIISDLLESINRNYLDPDISLRFERDDEGFTFQIWNYNDEAFSYSPRPRTAPDTVMYDLMYINKTIQEVIEVPSESGMPRSISRTELP